MPAGAPKKSGGRGEGGEEEGAPPDLGPPPPPPTTSYAARRNVVSARGGKATPCRACPACIRPDCEVCVYCKDKKHFGGPGKLKQRCKERKCQSPKVTIIIVLIINYENYKYKKSKEISSRPSTVPDSSSKAGMGVTRIVRGKPLSYNILKSTIRNISRT